MIIEVRVKNSYVFTNAVTLKLKADMRQKKFGFNIFSYENINILKSLGVYGPNNVGKTSLLKSIRNIRDVILNKKSQMNHNIFTGSPIVELGISFLEMENIISYDFKYNNKEKEFIYEKLTKIEKDQYGNEKEKIILLRDTVLKEYYFEDKTIETMMKLISGNNILIHLINETESSSLKSIKYTLLDFASKIDYVDMNNIPIQKTIDLLKNKNNIQTKIVNFILHADLDLDDFKYNEKADIERNISISNKETPEEKVLDIPDRVIDQIRLTSVYRGQEVPSIFFDSTGTKKIVALSSYIIEALEFGKILIIDELDSSIHFKLARAIVAMFNNELNKRAQLIFSVHDINLMDCKKLMRKEQIWFVHKDKKGVYLYSLSDFTASDGVRDTTDIIEKYKKGILGAIPEPQLINSLLEIEHGK